MVAAGPGTTPLSGITIAFESGRPLAEWDTALHVLGATWIREISDQIVGGNRVVTFIRQNPDLPIKIVATVPNTPYGSAAYWKDEQTVWAIMSEVYMLYAPGVHNPYP